MLKRTDAIALFLFIDFMSSLAWFPFWWSISVLIKMIGWCIDGLHYRIKQYSFKIWLKNFFVPMYGQYDWQGRAISVFMRLVVIIGRGIALAAEGVIYFVLILCWMIIPPLAFFLALQNIVSGMFMSQMPSL